MKKELNEKRTLNLRPRDSTAYLLKERTMTSRELRSLHNTYI